MMLDEAREALARDDAPRVLYRPRGRGIDRTEEGTVTSVNDRYVFVRSRGLEGGRATNPADLTLLAPDERTERRRVFRAGVRADAAEVGKSAAREGDWPDRGTAESGL